MQYTNYLFDKEMSSSWKSSYLIELVVILHPNSKGVLLDCS